MKIKGKSNENVNFSSRSQFGTVDLGVIMRKGPLID